jgi:hypothetical protein
MPSGFHFDYPPKGMSGKKPSTVAYWLVIVKAINPLYSFKLKKDFYNKSSNVTYKYNSYLKVTYATLLP